MIYSISFPKGKSPRKSKTGRVPNSRKREEPAYAYIADIPALNGKTIRFQPGLNIVVGTNGSGKSTTLNSCGLSLAAVQGGTSVVTRDWLDKVFAFADNENIIFTWNVVHDGQPAVYVDPRVVVGLSAGGFAFDDDFMSAGIDSLMFRGSTGEKTLARINEAAGMILGKVPMPSEVVYKISRSSVNDFWRSRLNVAEKLLRGDGSNGPPTIILDEPESCLSIPMQVNFWKHLIGGDQNRFANLQVIIATHSPFAFNIPFANYIELDKGYVEQCRKALREEASDAPK